MRKEFPNTLAQQNAHADYVYLLEAISAVLGAQRQPKTDLLEEPMSSSSIHHTFSGHAQVSRRLVVGIVFPYSVLGSVIAAVANGVVPHRVGNRNWWSFTL